MEIRRPWESLFRDNLKYGKDFIKYVIVGVLYTFINIFLTWLFIDILKTGTVPGAVLTSALIFVTKYFAYVAVGFMVKRFPRYAVVTGLTSAAFVVLMWLLVDILGVPAVAASAVIVYAMFIVRFLSYYAAGLVKK
jgi:putative flippase GtrA